MNRKICLITFIAFTTGMVSAQSNVMKRGFHDLVLGISSSELEEIVGFQGTVLSPNDYFAQDRSGRKKENTPEYKSGFDQSINYKFIMPIPVTRVLLKNDRVVMIEVSSYPDFTRPICLDSKTGEGLKFWDSRESMEKIYGKQYRNDLSRDGTIQYFYYDSKGIGFALANNEVRIIYFY